MPIPNLRPSQTDLHQRIFARLELLRQEFPHQNPNVLAVSPTGSGKTVVMGKNIESLDAPQVAIAHRQELIGQISGALANYGLRHGIIAPPGVVSEIRKAHLEEFNINYIDDRSHIKVAGVRSVMSNLVSDVWKRSVRRIHNDEAHHVQVENEWGIANASFTNADSIGYTATAWRGDGRGLGRGFGGIYDALEEAPDLRWHINQGYLTDYRLICEEVDDLDITQVEIGAKGDYKQKQLSEAVHKSRKLVGDVVDSYLKYAPGKLGITFAADIESAREIAQKFRDKGVPAEIITGKTPDGLRRDLLRRFKRREILQLVNVDLFGEGFDVPAVEVVSMARPTMSLSLYMQQFGRALRLMIDEHLQAIWHGLTPEQRLYYIAHSAKPSAIVIDHVNNWAVHYLPDWTGRVWTLEPRRARAAASDEGRIPLRRCPNPRNPQTGLPCFRAYERHLSCCPYCGHVPEPAERSSPQAVDGEVFEMAPEVLAALRGTVAANLAPPAWNAGVPYTWAAAQQNRHNEKVEVIKALTESMAVWCAGKSATSPRPLTDAEQRRAFYHVFNIDVLSARALDAKAAGQLRERIEKRLVLDNVVRSNLH